LTIEAGNLLNVGGTITISGTGVFNAAFAENTINYNASGAQSVINPNGATSGFYNLIFSGSGEKTLPASSLNINKDFTIEETAEAIASESLNITGNLTIESGASFATGSFDHFLEGNFENNGTFTASTGETFHFETESLSARTIQEVQQLHSMG
jgi:hypothetical protein